ncbi:MAG: DNA polymerase III subunit alpha [Nocardioides sp.]
MSPSGFVHLHVASGYSLQYGASSPHALVEAAAGQEMDALALTDRDGTYGAVKFVKACRRLGISPILGVDLMVRPQRAGQPALAATSAPARGGAFEELTWPRVTLLAHTGGAGGRAGWAAICRLTSTTHLAGARGRPVADLEAMAPWLAGGDVVVLLGPDSEFGRLAARHRTEGGRADEALAALEPWLRVIPRENLVVELVSHRVEGTGPGSSAHAAAMARLARRAGLQSVLTNSVRYAERRDAPVVDVLDAARRLVALDRRHVDRRNAEGFLKAGKQMHEIAEEICRLSGVGDARSEAVRLLARTRALADRCVLDPRVDLGIGEVHFPEFDSPQSAGAGALGARTPGAGATVAGSVLRARCEAEVERHYGTAARQVIWKRLHDELATIEQLGYASYFLTVADITDLIRERGIRCAARGSGAGSLVNYLLGVSGVDPIRHNLLMERFLSVRRTALPDIDIDVESARRTEIYEAILDRYGGERCVCVSMMDTYRVRHAVRDVGAALGMPPAETDAIAKAFPHIRARDARTALRELPELRASGLAEERLGVFFGLVERLDGLPRHIAMHPCGVLLSDATLLDRTPVEASFAGFPMSQFDKDDVEDLGLLKLDVLGIRMQSSMAHAVAEIDRTEGVRVDLDDQQQVPFDDPDTFSMISSARTLGVFQIESPGQRELVGKSGIDSFEDVIADISLFRPGPVKSDMITPYLEVKQGWRTALYEHPDLRPILGPTHGVVVYHEQVIELIAQFAGVDFAEGDEKRRALGDFEGMAETKLWFFPRALGRGYELALVEQVWRILEAFASFGFCKAHAAAFALPTYQSAWLKTHWPAHFLAGVLTHDPGMYPKRLILDDARQCGIEILGLDVNVSAQEYLVERLEEGGAGGSERWWEGRAVEHGQPYAIRLALAEVKGISAAEVTRIVAARDSGAAPYRSLTDFWQRTQVSRPIAERLVLAGGFDAIYGIGIAQEITRRDRVTRRDLLLQIAGLDQHARALARANSRARGIRKTALRPPPGPPAGAHQRVVEASQANSTDPLVRAAAPAREAAFLDGRPARDGVWAQAHAQSRAAAVPQPVTSVQLTLDLGDEPTEGELSGLPELTPQERMEAELEILGLDVSQHVVDRYADFLTDLGVTRSRDLLRQRSRSELLVAGVKVATQTPPVRSGRRVIFVTLDDASGPVDATLFEDVQGPYAATVFNSWLLVIRGELRRTGKQGVSLRATGAWELPPLHALWRRSGLAAVREYLDAPPPQVAAEAAGVGVPVVGAEAGTTRSRVLVHSSGYQISPYADVRPAGDDPRQVARKLWHRSPGSPG